MEKYAVDCCEGGVDFDANVSSEPLVDTTALLALAAECKYDLRALAARIGVSPRQLQRSFRSGLSCAPRDWLREQRLQKARQLLSTAPSVKHVAYALGFRQESQFCRDFKARFGHSPSRELPSRTLRQLFAK